MTIYNDAEIETMLADWQNQLTSGEATAPCLLDDGEELALEMAGGGGQVVRKISATIRTSDFPALQSNDAVSVDGIEYIVWRRLQLGDGALSELWLRLAESGS
jgi:hypothetical protein